MWLKSPLITCTHGFSVRHGGVSPDPFASLNFGGSQDLPENISLNRKKALSELGLSETNLALLRQVHGSDVKIAKRGYQESDALVTSEPGLALAISIADCYPLLMHDPEVGVIAAVHAGWRGTCALIAGKTVEVMSALGASPENIRVAIGQGICKEHFEVGEEVIQKFSDAGFPADCYDDGRTIDLIKSNIFTLRQKGIMPGNIWCMNRCTFEDDFFSYRRDMGITGRMWGVISL